jgi:hypothetical protein
MIKYNLIEENRRYFVYRGKGNLYERLDGINQQYTDRSNNNECFFIKHEFVPLHKVREMNQTFAYINDII